MAFICDLQAARERAKKQSLGEGAAGRGNGKSKGWLPDAGEQAGNTGQARARGWVTAVTAVQREEGRKRQSGVS